MNIKYPKHPYISVHQDPNSPFIPGDSVSTSPTATGIKTTFRKTSLEILSFQESTMYIAYRINRRLPSQEKVRNLSFFSLHQNKLIQGR